MEYLDRMHMAVPPDDVKIYRAMYSRWQVEARRSNRYYRFTSAQARKHNIDPIYTYVIERDDPRSHGAQQMNELLGSINNVNLRRAVDILLYLGDTPETIAATLTTHNFLPRIDVDLIELYWEFFWDVQSMNHESWKRYVGWMKPGDEMRYHVRSLGTKTHAMLRQDAYLGGAGFQPERASLKQMALLDAMFEEESAKRFEPGASVDINTLCQLSRTFLAHKTRFNAEEALDAEAKGDSDVPKRFRVILSERERQAENVSHEDLGITGLPIALQDLDGEFGDPYQTSMLRESGQEET